MTALAKSSTTIRVQWAPVTGATRYEIERSTDAVAWTPVARRNSDQTAYIDAALSSGTTYYYRVAAVDADANVSHSDVVSATTTGDASTAPVWISSTASDTSVDLAWSDVDGAVGYLIERSPDGTTGWATIGTTGQGVTTYTDSGLASATTYYYRVSALTSDGGSSYPSTSLAVTTQVAGPTTSDANALPSQAPTAP